MYVVWVLFVYVRKWGGVIEWQACVELTENLTWGYRIWCDVSTTCAEGM